MAYKQRQENTFKTKLINDLKKLFPNDTIFHGPANEIQGFPDIVILHEDGRWALLEGKADLKASYRPNQNYYINKLNMQGFARSICPENKEEVLNELYAAFRASK